MDPRQSSHLTHGSSEFGIKLGTSLIHAGPDDTIFACGEGRERVQNALKLWAKAIHRDKIISTLPVCRKNTKEFMVQMVPATEPGDLSTCRSGNRYLAFASLWTSYDSRSHLRGGRIVHCQNDEPTPVNSLMINAHEVGHHFGLCDQYVHLKGQLKVGMHEDCDAIFRSSAATKSLMTFYDANLDRMKVPELMRDDSIGIRLLACRSDISANALWAQKNTYFMQEWLADEDFQGEIRRLQAKGVDFIPACVR